MAKVSEERMEEILAGANSVQERIGIPEASHALGIGLYRLLLSEGRPVSPDELAEALNSSLAEVTEGLRTLPGLDLDGAGNIFGVIGLTLEQTRHKVHYGDRTIYGWCAADTLSVSRVLDRTVEIESADPVTGRKIEIIASPAGIERMDPEGVAMSMICWDLADKDGTRSSQEIRANACDYIFFFESVKTAEQWVAEHPATAVLTPDEIFELVRVAFEPPIEDLLMGQI